MTSHLTWQNFLEGIVRPGEDRSHSVETEPKIVIFADHSGARIGMLLQRHSVTPPDSNLFRLLMLEVDQPTIDGRTMLRVTCSRPSLFREAYLFFTAVIDRILQDQQEAVEAVQDELAALETFLDEAGILSIEKQIGLYGELLVLEQFIRSRGASMISSWTGPFGEAHDFRLANHEFEVKTAAGRRRVHTINSLTQASASPGASLCFLSILIGSAGPGEGNTLPSLVTALESSLAHDFQSRSSLRAGLEKWGYRSEDAAAYTRKWKLRAPLMLVVVDKNFPRLEPGLLQKALGNAYSRLEEVAYKVNLDGAGLMLENGLADHLAKIMKTQ